MNVIANAFKFVFAVWLFIGTASLIPGLMGLWAPLMRLADGDIKGALTLAVLFYPGALTVTVLWFFDLLKHGEKQNGR